MLRSPSGTYTSRPCPRDSSVVTRAICKPCLISEKSTRLPPSIQVRDDAFGKKTRGSPPSTGTSQTSHGPAVLYAIRVLSGEKIGLNFSVLSCVSCTGSPSGRNCTYICPRPKNDSVPRMNASILPSEDSAG